MKLRNKKTGEIVDCAVYCNGTFYHSVNDVFEEWEDYEEPKEHYFITEYGEVFSLNEYEGLNNVANPKEYESIGNYFETRGEAEKAVEKLKAWKRLRDKVLKINGWEFTPDMKHIKGNFIKIEAEIPYIQENMKDLDLLFGGEE